MNNNTPREEDIPLVQQQWTSYLLKAVCRRRTAYLKKLAHISDTERSMDDEQWRLIRNDQTPGPEVHMPLEVSLQEAIKVMPDVSRTIVQMRIFQGCTFLDIAQRLEMPVNTVKTVFYTAAKKIRGELDE